MYYATKTSNSADLEQVSAEEIKTAVATGLARLVHGYADGKTTTYLSFSGEDFDTRGQTHSVWESAWTTTPKSITQALAYARSTS